MRKKLFCGYKVVLIVLALLLQYPVNAQKTTLLAGNNIHIEEAGLNNSKKILKEKIVLVTDSLSRPIEGVLLFNRDFFVVTNEKGEALLKPIGADTDTLVNISHANYKSQTFSYQQIIRNKFTIVLYPKNYNLDEVTVSANKRRTLSRYIPSQFVKLSPRETRLANPQTSADLLGASGDVYIQKSQLGGGSPMIRGFAANRLLIVVDGVRMNNAIYRSGNLQNVISVDVNALEESEVLLGPSSVIFGSDALGGVLNFQTKKPEFGTNRFLNSGNVMVRSSSANLEKTGHIDLNFGGKNLTFLSSLTYSGYNHLLMGKYGREEYLREEYVIPGSGASDKVVENNDPQKQYFSGFKQYNFLQKIRFRAGNLADFTYTFNLATTSDIPRYDRLIQKKGDQLKYAEWYYGPQKWIFHSLGIKYFLNSRFADKANIIFSYQDYTESRNDRKLYSEIKRERDENVDVLSFNADFDKSIGNRWDFYYGVELLWNKVHSEALIRNIETGETNLSSTRYPNGSEWMSAALYANALIKQSDIFSWQFGTRYSYAAMHGVFDLEYFNFPFERFENSHGAMTGSVGFSFFPNTSLRFKMNLATGFRSPNIDDVAKVFDSEPGTVIVPNPNLKPEYAAGIDGGIEFLFNQKVHMKLSFFYTRLFDAMIRDDYLLNGKDTIIYDGERSKVEALVNASSANIYGASLSSDIEIIQPLKFKVRINWQDGADNHGRPLRHIVPLFGDCRMVYQKNKFTTELYTVFNGPILYNDLADEEKAKTHLYVNDRNGDPYSPSWWTLNLKTRIKLNNKLDLNAGCENIFNRRYRPYSSGIVSPGRNFILSIYYTF